VQRGEILTSLDADKSPAMRCWMLVAWPAFLASCLLEGLVFALFDPGEIHWPRQLAQMTSQGVYTLAFFSFWLITMVCSRLVLWLAQPARKINDTSAN
jgi:hypothetical protein